MFDDRDGPPDVGHKLIALDPVCLSGGGFEARRPDVDGVPNLVLTPHVAGVTGKSNPRISAVTASSVLRALDT